MDDCPPVFWDQAPVPCTTRTVVVEFHAALVDDMVSRRQLLDLPKEVVEQCMTRFMMDVMVHDPEFAVVPQHSHCALALFTNKTPGLMNVRSAMQGVPIVGSVGCMPRPIRDVHPTCAIRKIDVFDGVPRQPVPGPPRAIPQEELEAIPLFQQLMTPSASPFALRGVELSVYCPKTGTTLMAGTRHSWVCLGALTYDRIMRPFHPVHHPLGLFGEEVDEPRRRACFELLHAALFNVTALETFWNNGAWSRPDAVRRSFLRPYALDNGMLTAAVFWVFGYPGFVQDWTTPDRYCPPGTGGLDVWHVKTYCKAFLEYAARFGRIVRMLLNNRVRNIRRDYSEFVLGTYYCATCDDARPMRLVDTFSNCIKLGEGRDKQDAMGPSYVASASSSMRVSSSSSSSAPMDGSGCNNRRQHIAKDPPSWFTAAKLGGDAGGDASKDASKDASEDASEAASEDADGTMALHCLSDVAWPIECDDLFVECGALGYSAFDASAASAASAAFAAFAAFDACKQEPVAEAFV
jgi:hypothetical protein